MNMELSKKQHVKKTGKSVRKSPDRKAILKRRIILRRFFLVLICSSFAFLLLFGLYFLLSKIFSVKHILVKGESEYSESEIISASEVGKETGILFLNSKNIENNIYKSLVNIDKVKISKKVPGTVIISVEKAIPAYNMKVGDEYLVISSKNKFLTKSSEVPEGTIGIVGIEAEIKSNGKIEYKDTELWNLFEEILNSFKYRGIDSINQIDVSDLQNITLMYENRIKINIGNKEDMDYKILTLKEIINTKISKGERGVLNLKDLEAKNRTYFTYV